MHGLQRSSCGLSKYILLIVMFGLLLFASYPANAQLTTKDITELNKRAVDEGWTFTIKENDATQYPLEQICGTHVPEGYVRPRGHIDNSLGAASLPPAFDWRTVTPMPPIRNQGGCGSCWAFSTIGALECAVKVYEGEVVNLSEQWLVSCNQSGWGCAGGWLAFDYLMKVGDPCGGSGAVLETNFPYTASNGSCHCPYPHDYKIDNWAFVGSEWAIPSVAAMKQAIMDHGPISVCVTANSAFQGYGGGIFNACSYEAINHAVVLVGWDDTQGPGGVWIMRNSWGSGWGEGGYMRITYNCCNIGFGAAYIEYGGVGFAADTKFGPGPDTISFTGNTTRAVTGWNWEFGDGATSTLQNPIHEYAPGCYNVKLTVQTPTGNFASTKTDFIMLYADSFLVDNAMGCAGKGVCVNICAHNYLPISSLNVPFTWAGANAPILDSVTIAGTRSARATLNVVNDDTNNKRRTYQIDFSSAPGQALTSGNGPVLSLYFRVGSGVPDGACLPVKVQSYGFQTPQFTAGTQAFSPEVVNGQITLCLAGDFTNDNIGPDIADLSGMIAFLFLQGPPPSVVPKADIDGTAGIDIGDITALINYLYLSGPRLSCRM